MKYNDCIEFLQNQVSKELRISVKKTYKRSQFSVMFYYDKTWSMAMLENMGTLII